MEVILVMLLLAVCLVAGDYLDKKLGLTASMLSVYEREQKNTTRPVGRDPLRRY